MGIDLGTTNSLVAIIHPDTKKPVVLLLLAGSNGYYGMTSPKIFLGALMGLTTLPTFGVVNFVQSSLLSAVLFHLGILDGFGGKLGCLAYAGVLFGMS